MSTPYRAYDRGLVERGVHLGPRVNEPQPFCWMCSATSGRRSREHIVAQRLLKEVGIGKHERLAPSHFTSSGRLLSRRGPMTWWNFVGGEVCATCNNGWMEQLETAFGKLVLERPRSGRLTLADQRVLRGGFLRQLSYSTRPRTTDCCFASGHGMRSQPASHEGSGYL
jgi:hypothetical protein